MTDRTTRILTAVAVLIVAAIAATVSFVHIEHLAVTHGQTVLASALLPLSIDGTVAATSLAMLRAARAGVATPALARFGLVLSVGATLAANVGYGLPFGAAGALISGWPAIAFIVCAELAIGMVRRMRADVSVGMVPASVPADAQSAALVALRATTAAGNPLSGRQLETRFGLSRAEATRVRQLVAADANGHAPEQD